MKIGTVQLEMLYCQRGKVTLGASVVWDQTDEVPVGMVSTTHSSEVDTVG